MWGEGSSERASENARGWDIPATGGRGLRAVPSDPEGLPRPLGRDIARDVRYILDTNVIVAALRSTRGASAEVLRGVRQGRGVYLLSTALLLEYEATTKRPGQLAASGLTEAEVDVVLDVLAARAERVETSYRWRPQLHDAADEMVLEAAVSGRADAIVTFNARDFGDAPTRFGIAVIGPKDLLRRTT
jgi:putative PIN family toxin of toxin-antitoxin system